MKEKKFSFTASDSLIIKGVAIILMLMHHLWMFPDTKPDTLNHLITIFNTPLPTYLASFGKICVSLFLFLGGYGTYITAKKKKDWNIFVSIKKLYIKYWKVFFIFIPIAFIFFRHQIPFCKDPKYYNAFSNFSFKVFFKNLLGLSSEYNGTWWFLKSYIIAIISFPLLKRITEKYNTTLNIFLIIIYSIALNNILPAIGNIEIFGTLKNNYLYSTFITQTPFVACFWLGIVFAKDNLLFKLYDALNQTFSINFLTDIIGLCIIVFMRNSVFNKDFDLLLCPFFCIFSLDLIKKTKLSTNIFTVLGVHSTNIWLTHVFFCSYFYFFANIVFKVKWAIPSLILLIILSYVSSLLIEKFWDLFNKIYNKIKQKRLSKI